MTRTRAPQPRGDSYRPDLQGLRALAVSMVVIYHLFPRALPGGFAGVDLFFVISGYLISGHLLRGWERNGRVGLVDFWGRRARRLIPAAVLVLAVTWLLSWLVLPRSRLTETAEQIRASALYVQNWTLAHDAVDYLKADDAPSPVQHFWSLSVEEQFYLLWPLLFVAAALLARRFGPRGGRITLLALTSAVVVASLVYSAVLTSRDPAAAYFVTPTRIWELGFGGLLALLPARLGTRVARHGWLGWIGLAAVLGSAFALNASSAFPGVVALLPVGGAVLLIAGGSPRARRGPAVLTTARPLVLLGDCSYSLYLWHWPLIVLWSAWFGGVSVLAGLLLASVSVLLAWLTKVLVEDRVRTARLLAPYPWRSLSTAAAAGIPVLLVAVLAAPRAGSWQGGLGAGHPGAAVLAGDASRVRGVSAIPPAAVAATDLPAYEKDHCEVGETSSTPLVCTFGDTTAPTLTVALVGDSIAGEWFPALERIAEQRHWRLLTDIHSQCPWTAAMTLRPDSTQDYTACQQWGASVLHDLLTALHPDVVVTSDRAGMLTPGAGGSASTSAATIGAGMASYWQTLIAHSIPVVPIQESPELYRSVPDCLSAVNSSAKSCAVAVDKALMPDPPTVRAAASLAGAVDLIDMNSLICGPTECPAVVGNVVVYRDSHHLTNTYALSLAPYLERRLLATGAITS